MTHLDAPKSPEAEQSSVPPKTAQEAQKVNEQLLTPREPIPLDVSTILYDLGVTNEQSPEGVFLTEALTGLNARMKTMNTRAQQVAKSMPSYFKNTNQLEIEWDAEKQQLTLISQGQEVMKFELGLRQKGPDVTGDEGDMGVYMKNLLVDESSSGTSEVDPEDFMNFATQTDQEGDNAGERGLRTFEEMYIENNGYLNTYANNREKIVPTKQTRNIVLPPRHAVKLTSSAVNTRSVTLNNIFSDPKPFVVEIVTDGKITIAHLQSNGTYSDPITKARPVILTGSVVKNTTSFEEVQLIAEQTIAPVDQPKRYTAQALFPDLATRPKKFQDAVVAYMGLFADGKVEIETNRSGMRTYVDMNNQAYVLHYELNNAHLNKSYHQNLLMDLTGVLVYQDGKPMFIEEAFKKKLADQVASLVRRNFMRTEHANDITPQRGDFTSAQPLEKISARKRAYKRKSGSGRMTYCSEAAQHTALDNFAIQLPSGNALDAIKKSPQDPHYLTYTELSGTQSLTQLGEQGMHDLLSNNLSKGCTLVDIGYKSTTRNGRKYGHRNLASYCYDTRQRYIYDPVSNYGGGVQKKGIPLGDVQTEKFKPALMRFYKPDVGVYERDEGIVV